MREREREIERERERVREREREKDGYHARRKSVSQVLFRRGMI